MMRSLRLYIMYSNIISLPTNYHDSSQKHSGEQNQIKHHLFLFSCQFEADNVNILKGLLLKQNKLLYHPSMNIFNLKTIQCDALSEDGDDCDKLNTL